MVVAASVEAAAVVVRRHVVMNLKVVVAMAIQPEKEEAIELDGTVSQVLAGTMFRVKLRTGHEVLAHISGKMRKRFIRLVVGDAVKIEMSPYDTEKARIVYRL